MKAPLSNKEMPEFRWAFPYTFYILYFIHIGPDSIQGHKLMWVGNGVGRFGIIQASTLTLAPRLFWGCLTSLGHKFPYFIGPVGQQFQPVFIPLVTSTDHRINRLSLPCHPGATIKHNLHLIWFRVVAILF